MVDSPVKRVAASAAKRAAKRPTTKPTPKTANLLLEIGTEELPPQALLTLAKALADGVARGLVAGGVLGEADAGRGRVFATPRRLGLWLPAVAARAAAGVTERRGPSVQAATDADGAPSRAALGFARSCGVDVSALTTQRTDKGAWLVFRQRSAGAGLAAVLAAALADSVRQLPTPKRMRWGAGEVEFVRPAHSLLALHGARVVKVAVLGLQAGRVSRGHRFLADRAITIADADCYAEVLRREGKVIADFAERRGVIERQLVRLAARAGAVGGESGGGGGEGGASEESDAGGGDNLAGGGGVGGKSNADGGGAGGKSGGAAGDKPTPYTPDPALLDLVTALVEWPQALLGEFDRRFLALPAEVLVASMRDHQKFFHLTDSRGRLLPAFLAVANIRAAARVRRGNERVLRARLADAEFFWQRDLRTPPAERVAALRGVLFHRRLGSVHDKTARLAALAAHIARAIGADAEATQRAAWLSKTDLLTDMVAEFPALQGDIGRHYALAAGEPRAVADAIAQHYRPRHAGDELPAAAPGMSLALAERLDTLLGLFAAAEVPGGDKDPFGLRRAALGVLRILIEKGLDLDLQELLAAGVGVYRDAGGEVSADTPVAGGAVAGSAGATSAPAAGGAAAVGSVAAGSGAAGNHAAATTATTPDATATPNAAIATIATTPDATATPNATATTAAMPDDATAAQVLAFTLDRLRAYYQPLGFSAEELAAVLACAPARPLDFDRRLRALRAFFTQQQAAAEALAAANKRIANILRKADSTAAAQYQDSLLREPAERELAKQLAAADAEARRHFAAGRYERGITVLAGLKPSVDAFFDSVMVLDDDPAVRGNRLALLAGVRRLFLEVADISKMGG